MSSISRLSKFPSRLVIGADREHHFRVEVVLAVARVFLSAIALLANWLDVAEPSPYRATAHWVLLAYAGYSLALFAGVKLAGSALSERVPFLIHAVDLLWPAVVGFLTQGPDSPFFVLLMFAVVAAGYRWGFRAALGTASVTLLLFSLKGGLFTYGEKHSVPSSDTQSDLVRTAYLLAMGFLIANLAENEKRAQAEISAVARALGSVRPQRGLRSSLQAALHELLEIFEAEKILIAVEEARSKRLYLWEARQGEEGHQVATNFSEVDPGSRETYLFHPPADALQVGRRSSAGFGQVLNIVSLDAEGKPIKSEAGDFFPLQFPWEGFDMVMAAAFAMADEWSGRLFLFNTRTGRRAKEELRFLQAFVRQLMPALYGAYALGRVRSRAGAIERLRVARGLHDGAIQSLIGAEMYVDALRRRVAADRNGIGEDLERVQQLLRDEVVNLRELMQQLKPLDLDSRELTGFIAELADRFRKETGNSIEFVTDLDEIDLPPVVLSELAKIVQEALVNVRKHSKARNVLIQLRYENGRYKIVVDDDGQGFGWAGRLSLQELQATRRGPIIIKERVQGIGGELLIDSTPGGGTRLEVSVPRRTSSTDGTLFEPHPYPPR